MRVMVLVQTHVLTKPLPGGRWLPKEVFLAAIHGPGHQPKELLPTHNEMRGEIPRIKSEVRVHLVHSKLDGYKEHVGQIHDVWFRPHSDALHEMYCHSAIYFNKVYALLTVLEAPWELRQIASAWASEGVDYYPSDWRNVPRITKYIQDNALASLCYRFDINKRTGPRGGEQWAIAEGTVRVLEVRFFFF